MTRGAISFWMLEDDMTLIPFRKLSFLYCSLKAEVVSLISRANDLGPLCTELRFFFSVLETMH